MIKGLSMIKYNKIQQTSTNSNVTVSYIEK